MFGWVPRLPVNIEYGITQPQLIEQSRQNYARKLRAKLNLAFKVAKETSDKNNTMTGKWVAKSLFPETWF